MSETDLSDFAYLVEQIFVCLFESYRSDLLVGLLGTVDTTKGIEHVEAVQAAHYFKKVSEKVFSETRFFGAINRSSFGVSHGANYSMPFKEWAVSKEQLLILRWDTAIKSKSTGYTIPITEFRSQTEDRKSHVQEEWSSPRCLRRNVRLPEISSWKALLQSPSLSEHPPRKDGASSGRALPTRIRSPPKSGKWRHRFLFTRKVYTFQDNDQVGSPINYINTIAMVRWLFNAEPNKPQPWMPHLKGCAHVLQTVYNYHTQTIEVKLQELFAMRSGGLKPRARIVAAMQALGLDNVDGTFGQQKMCDTCAMLSTKALRTLGSACIHIPGIN